MGLKQGRMAVSGVPQLRTQDRQQRGIGKGAVLCGLTARARGCAEVGGLGQQGEMEEDVVMVMTRDEVLGPWLCRSFSCSAEVNASCKAYSAGA